MTSLSTSTTSSSTLLFTPLTIILLLLLLTSSFSLSLPSTPTKRPTKPFLDQRPGTSGLRKKTKVWIDEPRYLSNLIQSYLNVLTPTSLLVASDGRYLSTPSITSICSVAGASGVKEIHVPKGGVASTPSCSAYIRDVENKVEGGIILTASHNPGGMDGDFGVKFNGVRGEPVDENFTERVWEETKVIQEYGSCEPTVEIDVHAEVGTVYDVGECRVRIVDPFVSYVGILEGFFDFGKIRKYAKDGNKVLFDGMHGAGGPFARRVLGQMLGFGDDCFMRCDSREDFGGCHPDPNLTYGKELVGRMGLDGEGRKTGKGEGFVVGAANDGDGDRNLICGDGVFVTPSDSLAIIADRWKDVKKGGGELKGVARSMPSSAAVDVVAERKGIRNFVTPTGWKFFGNLMDSKDMGGDDFNPFLCGEESFGTGSSHIREKDGLWAVLAWLSILSESGGSVEDVVTEHWGKYGRHYYARYDYEECGSEGANDMMEHLKGIEGKEGEVGTEGGLVLTKVENFQYEDPVTGEVTKNQGMILSFETEAGAAARAVFRLSGTGSSGATVRMYLEKYDEKNIVGNSQEELKGLGVRAAGIAKLEEFTGRKEPTVIT